ncbi:DUF4261 domain-containing protein [Corynebacterium terpenotabidum]|nr:DUF4261 domain-containing protein [Corynebacterium terpenotabidum]
MSEEKLCPPSPTFAPQLVLGVMLFDEPPTVDAVIDTVTSVPGDLGITAGEVAGRDGIVEVTVGKTGVTAFLSVIDEPVPGGEAVGNAHQLYCQGEEKDRVAAHQAQLLIAVPAEFTEDASAQISGLSAREIQLVANRIHGILTMAMTRLPGVAGYYSGAAAATYGPTFLAQVAEGHFGSTPWPLWVSARLHPGEQGFSAYTTGLWALGHPELQVDNAPMPPEDLFLYLMDTSAHLVLDGGTFADGQTTGRYEGERFTLGAEPWIVDPNVPALRVRM